MRFLLLATALFTATAGLQASNADLWKQYNDLKKVSPASLTESVQGQLEMARVTLELNRPDIAAWRYNDAGYKLVKEFMALTNYDATTADINHTKKGERKAKREAFKTVLQANVALLDEAQGHLLKAISLSDEDKLKRAVDSNIGFIQWVKTFIENN